MIWLQNTTGAILMKRGKIILINGASSAGKTSIVRALQPILDEAYLEAGLDKFLFMLPMPRQHGLTPCKNVGRRYCRLAIYK